MDQIIYLELAQTYFFFTQMDVKEASEVPTDHPQWDISNEKEEDKISGGSDSEFATDNDESDKD